MLSDCGSESGSAMRPQNGFLIAAFWSVPRYRRSAARDCNTCWTIDSAFLIAANSPEWAASRRKSLMEGFDSSENPLNGAECSFNYS